MADTKRRKRDESSSDEDDEARRINEEKRKRRREEHEKRKDLRRLHKEKRAEERCLANMSDKERKQFLKEKEKEKERREIEERQQRVVHEQELRASQTRKEEEEFERKRKEWATQNKPWSFDDDDDVDDEAMALDAEATNAMEAGHEADPLMSYLSSLDDPTQVPIIGVDSQHVATLDEVRTLQWNQKKRLLQREIKGEAAVPEAEPEDEEDGASFLQALTAAAKGLADGARAPQPQESAEQPQQPRQPQAPRQTIDTALLNEEGEEVIGQGPHAKASVAFDFDEDEFRDRSYGLEKQEAKVKDLRPVDHSSRDYHEFRKALYVEAKAIRALTPQQISETRQELDQIKVRGKNIPAPISRWEQCGFSDAILEALTSLKFVQPSPIQAQGMPVIMSGRDMIGCARTGSGKTLAYLLPMFRHILDQLPLKPPGVIAYILVPTRELAAQVAKVAGQFTGMLRLSCVTAYGGPPIAEQIADCRRGAHFVIGTPGRVIDLMVANKGKVLDTFRTTFCVLDEADRLFDRGFGPQIAKILANMRPDRQTVMFSATFPKQVEAAAKRFLNEDAVEVVIGGRCTASTNVTQHVECFEDEGHKFLRLLQLLGEWHTRGLVLIFTERQDEVDSLWEALDKHGYGSQAGILHAGMDQVDREVTLTTFCMGQKHILIATSVAARGIDVADLDLVVNYRVPDHIEDYIHRIGRTGRTQKRGEAYTFYRIGEDERHATWLVNALENSQNEVPEELQIIANKFWEDRNNGLVKDFRANRGFGGSGYKFDARETRQKKEEVRKQMRERGLTLDSDSDAESEQEEKVNVTGIDRVANVTKAGGELAISMGEVGDRVGGYANTLSEAIMQAKQLEADGKFTTELEINDYPQKARWLVTNKEKVDDIMCSNSLEVTVMTKGAYSATGRLRDGERKLYIQIDGTSRQDVDNAKRVFKNVLEEAMQNALAATSSLGVGRAIKGR